MKLDVDKTARALALAASFARTDEDRQVLELIFSQGAFGRPFDGRGL